MLWSLAYPTGVGGELIQRNEHLHPRTALGALIDTSWVFLLFCLHEQHCTIFPYACLRRFQVWAQVVMSSRFQSGLAEMVMNGLGKSDRLRSAWICCFGQLRMFATSAVPPIFSASIVYPILLVSPCCSSTPKCAYVCILLMPSVDSNHCLDNF